MPNVIPTLKDIEHNSEQLAGKSIRLLAAELNISLPANLKTNKGFIGQLVERALGLVPNSSAQADFDHLGLELKTIPINSSGKVQESTYVTTLQLNDCGTKFKDSLVYQKIKHILWIPVYTNKVLAKTTIGKPIFWKPNNNQLQALQTDYNEIMEMIYFGEIEQITADIGTYLHIRPKAANAKALSWIIDASGNCVQTLPRGFYLRTALTQKIV